MRGSPFQKSLLILLSAAIVTALLLQWLNAHFQKTLPAEPPSIVKAEHEYHYTPPAHPAATPSVATNADEADEQIPVPKISREQAEAWLTKHNRNAMSLLAAFRALGDTNYLNEAATNFPNDPRVELTILARDAFPAERRKWLDLFKASSPSNSLANYFSAEEHFKNGKTDEAVQDILAASTKSQFENHSMETQLDAEQLYLNSGKSPREAAGFGMSDMSQESLPELATMKRVAGGIKDLMKQKSDAGDTDSVASLAQMGLAIADKLNSGDSGKYLINQLVGMSTEAIALSQLNQNTSYDFLNGQTPAQVLQQLKDQKLATRQVIEKSSAAYLQMTEDEMVIYAQRAKIFGEIETMKWLIQQHPPVDSPK